MEERNTRRTKTYFIAMALYWLIFGLITIFFPKLMEIFQTPTGIEANSKFSNHVWLHGGFDILAFCILLFALSKEKISRYLLLATALAAMMPAIAITFSLVRTPYWKTLFFGAALGCFVFAVWGYILAVKKPVK